MLTISASPAFYRLASQTIFLNPSIPEMQPFRLDTQIFSEPPLPPNLDELYVSAPSLRAEGWISDRLETITFWRDDQGVLLDIPSAGRFWTSADGAAIRHISGPPELEPSILAQSLLGPPLVLALALNGVWCLHASAIIIEDRAVVFLGNSGAGKSTLAAFLREQPGAQRVGDDILPVTWENGALFALPRFPQLKLPITAQPGLTFPEKIPLAAVYLLDKGSSIRIEAAGPAAATLTLASHSVAARLFDRQLLGAHLDFCAQAAKAASVRRLIYPRIFAELPAVWQALQADQGELHG